jgi:transketolase
VQARREVIEMIYSAGQGCPGGSLSSVEILTALYFEGMRLRPEEPKWPERDRFVLSKGHVSAAMYAVMAHRGYFPLEELKTFNKPGTRLEKHIDIEVFPYGEVSSGSLGQGLSVAVGMALADWIDGNGRRVYALIGDGESQEGQIWEAAMFAAQKKLGNLVAFVDHNGCQVDGYVRDICDLEPVEHVWDSLGWHVQRVDGHDLRQLVAALEIAHRTSDGRPHMIIADTIEGKCISYMEGSHKWHAGKLTEEQYCVAMADLEAVECALAEEGATK